MRNHTKKEIDKYGNIFYYNKKGKYHNDNGPAVIWTNGDKEWYMNGIRHRIDGPAIEWEIECYVEWWFNGELHREDGPAVEAQNGLKLWYINNMQYTEEIFFYELSYKEKYQYNL